MNKVLKNFVIVFIFSMFFISCAKKPLTLDEKTPMKALLKASDDDIKALVVSEIQKQKDIPEEQISIQYVLRDEKSQTIAVKIKIDQ